DLLLQAHHDRMLVGVAPGQVGIVGLSLLQRSCAMALKIRHVLDFLAQWRVSSHGNLASMFKYYGSEQNKRKFELLLEMMGSQALG
ncbi:MAG: hypothetical protein HC937_03890, partial [Aquincola sp.]|nr:hypothetical protein [Aquincola sp.]